MTSTQACVWLHTWHAWHRMHFMCIYSLLHSHNDQVIGLVKSINWDYTVYFNKSCTSPPTMCNHSGTIITPLATSYGLLIMCHLIPIPLMGLFTGMGYYSDTLAKGWNNSSDVSVTLQSPSLVHIYGCYKHSACFNVYSYKVTIRVMNEFPSYALMQAFTNKI